MSDNPLILQYSDGNLVPYQTPDPAQAAQRALDFTGIPDLVSGANALARGEWLPGLGQAASGAAGLLPLGKLAGAAKLGAELMPLAGMVKAWHGTPHLFEPVEHNPFGEFRDAAIGTGEGAQAYGHGHYVAGNRGVAEDYQRSLSENKIQIDNAPWNPTEEHELIAQSSLEANQGIGNRPDTDGALADLNAWMKQGVFFQGEEELHKKAVQFIEANKDKMQYGSGGSLLEVHILPDEHELLDWDRPLAEQPPGVQSALQKLYDQHGENLKILAPWNQSTGEQFYRNFSLFNTKPMSMEVRDEPAASAALHEAGIPGIKYLDQGSRNSAAEQMLREDLKAGIITQKEFEAKTKATSNYVIFDPKNLRIVGRNGQRLEPVEEDPFK